MIDPVTLLAIVTPLLETALKYYLEQKKHVGTTDEIKSKNAIKAICKDTGCKPRHAGLALECVVNHRKEEE